MGAQIELRQPVMRNAERADSKDQAFMGIPGALFFHQRRPAALMPTAPRITSPVVRSL